MLDNLFLGFDNTDRIWIYAFSKSLLRDEMEIVEQELSHFTHSWKSHGTTVTGTFHILYDRFVILCASSQSEVSGCSVDSSTRVFKQFKEKYDLDALDQNLIHYRENGQIYSRPRADFFLDPNLNLKYGTTIFDLSLQTLGELRTGNFEIPVEESMLAQKISA